MNDALVASRVSKRFGSVVALHDASVALQRGRITALIGGNGSGKSTFANVLAGVVAPDRGELRIGDKRIRIASPIDAYRLGISVTFQELSILPNLTLAENILVGHLPTRGRAVVDRRALNTVAEKALAEAGLDVDARTAAGSLDSAQLHMLELAKAISWRPSFLIVDELTAALRASEVSTVFAVLRRLAQKGTSILFVSHRLTEIYEVCSEAVVMRNGEVVGAYQLPSTPENELLAAMLGGRRVVKSEDEKAAAWRRRKRSERVQLRVEGLRTRRYEEASFDLVAREGEVVGLGGLQGQGQGEIVRTLFGAERATVDRYELGDRELSVASPAKAVRLGIGFISGDRQREGIFPTRSIAENLRAVQPNAPAARVAGLLEQLRVVHKSLSQPVRELSGGSQQKVVFGRWFLRPALRLLLLDDPTKGADVAARLEMHDLIRKAARAGATVVLASSDDHELAEIADLIYIIYRGSIMATISGAEATEHSLGVAAMGAGHR